MKSLCWFQGQVCFSFKTRWRGMISSRNLAAALLNVVCIVSGILNLFGAMDHFGSLENPVGSSEKVVFEFTK